MAQAKTKGQWISELLQEEIRGGTWAPGELLPSQNVLAERYKISVATVREAFSALSHQGLIESKQGKGTFVAQNNAAFASQFVADLEQRSHRNVGLITGRAQYPYYAELTAGIEAAGREEGYSLLINMHSTHAADKRESFERLRSPPMDAFIIGPVDDQAEIDYIVQDRVLEKIVVFSCMKPVDAHYVSIDRSVGIRDAMQFLYEQGHRRIALFSGEPRIAIWGRRIGFERALEELNLDPAECPTIYHQDSSVLETARSLALRALQGPNRPTAILAHNDMAAMGVLGAAQEAGLEVPRDLSVVGFDNIQFAAHAAVPLTTVDMRMAEMGQEIIKIVRQLRSKTAGPRHHVLMTPNFVIRDSVGPAPV